MKMGGGVHLQLNTTHCLATALLRSFVVSVLPGDTKVRMVMAMIEEEVVVVVVRWWL